MRGLWIAAGVVALSLAYWLGGLPVVFLAVPALAAGLCVITRPSWALEVLDDFEALAPNLERLIRVDQGRFSKYIVHPWLWGISKVGELTASIHNVHQRAAVRIAAYLYPAAAIALVAYFTPTVVVGLVLAIVSLIVLTWVLERMVGDRREPEITGVRSGRVRAAGPANQTQPPSMDTASTATIISSVPLQVREKVKCSHCMHKLARLVCGCPEGPYFRQTMEPNNHCDLFVNNPAQDHFSEALVTVIMQDEEEDRHEHERRAREIIAELEEALQLGLPEDDELTARAMLGDAYFSLLPHMAEEEWPRSRELARALREIEHAVMIDARGGYGHFVGPLHGGSLARLGTAYMWTCRSDALLTPGALASAEDFASRIQYLEGKLRQFDYLRNPPLFLLLHLGELYAAKGERQRAQEYFARVVDAPVNPAFAESDAAIKTSAARQLENLESGDRQ